MAKYFIAFSALAAVLYGSFLFLNLNRKVALAPLSSSPKTIDAFSASETAVADETGPIEKRTTDIENQKPLENPPKAVKALYLTSWTAGSPSRMSEIIKLVKEAGLNAVVIDIKDYSGYVAYDIQNADVVKYRAKEIKIPRVNALIKRLHDEGIYVIARQTVFQDPILAKARPDLALQNKLTGGTWYDKKGLAWIDPAAKDAWDYNVAIAKDAAERGFDEINFDYVRFASDGDLSIIGYPFFDEKNRLKKTIIAEFFKYLRERLTGVVISADLFGLSTVNYDDLGIGQSIEDAFKYFDFVSPMVYPSHYAKSFLGFQNPADYPYEVVNYSMASAARRLQNMPTSTAQVAKLRPWLQSFDLGAVYDAQKIKAQIKAVSDAGLNDGFMFWDPSNRYPYLKEALR